MGTVFAFLDLERGNHVFFPPIRKNNSVLAGCWIIYTTYVSCSRAL